MAFFYNFIQNIYNKTNIDREIQRLFKNGSNRFITIRYNKIILSYAYHKNIPYSQKDSNIIYGFCKKKEI